MDSSVIVAALGFLGTILGSGLGVIASSKLTNFRIEKLEEKVAQHNKIIERTYILEGQVTEIFHDIKELKSYHNKGGA